MSYIEIQRLNKEFPGVKALQDVSFRIQKGTVHGLLGENGAGKSTLMKIISGSLQADSGAIYIGGQLADIQRVCDAERLGISIVYQELSLLNNLSVAQNLFIMQELKSSLRLIDDKRMERESRDYLQSLGIGIDVGALVANLSLAEKQMIEIIKVIWRKPKIVIFDEPTSSLDKKESNILFEIIRNLKREGTTFIYISHKMEEIFQICDEVTVLKDGCFVGTVSTEDSSEGELITMMIGRTIKDIFPPKQSPKEREIALSCRNISSQYYKNISFDLYKGEVLGLYGLIGAGRTEIAKGIFGLLPAQEGQLEIDGQPVQIRQPADAMKRNMAFVSENRQKEGLVISHSIKSNISMAALDKIICRGLRFMGGFISEASERCLNTEKVQQLRIKISSLEQITNNYKWRQPAEACVGKMVCECAADCNSGRTNSRY